MNVEGALSKYKPLIIVIILFLLVFSLRAGADNLSSVSSQVKPFYEDANGLPYFSEMDSYFNYRMTADYVDHGYMGDVKINGTQWDLHSYYPPGREAAYTPMIVYVTAFTYKFVNLFAKVPLTTVAFWIGAFIASLAVIPAYLFIRRITNDYGGITAAILVGTAPFYFSHTFAGFFDTDMFNMLLPLLTVWFFVESFRANDIRNRTIFAVLSAISMLLFSLAWEGWIYIFYLVIITTVIYLLVSNYLLRWKTIKKPGEYDSKMEWFQDQPGIFALVVFFVLSSVLIMISSGPSDFATSLLGPVGFTQLQATVQQTTAYPNVFVSVGELQVPGVMDAINNVGGLVVFVFSLLGVFLLFWRLKPRNKTTEKVVGQEKTEKKTKKRRRSERRKDKKQEEKAKETEKKFIMPDLKGKDKKNYLLYAILLSIWLLITAYAMTKGVRFAEAFALPVALGAGIFVGLMLGYVKGYVKNPSYQTIIMVILLVAAAFAPVSSAYAISHNVLPGTDDSMVNSLIWIKNNTPSNTVITSWWDYGHLFAAVADRGVTFDGGTQNSPRAYWVGKALLTSNETLSAGILTMLSTTGDLGPLTMDNYTKSTGKSVEILDKTLGVDKATALTIMTSQYGLTQEQAQNMVQYTHPDNPTPDVLITSSDMVGKAGWWTYFGNWNFQTNSSQSYSYVPGQGVIVPNNETGLSNNTTVLLAENAIVAEIVGNNVTAGIINVNELKNQNMSTSEMINKLLAGVQGNNTLVIKPHKLIVVQDNNVTQNDVVSADSPYSIIIVKTNGTYMTYLMNKELEDSIFTKLYLLRGQGITKFALDFEQPGVMVWRVI
ncbi:MAG: Oligosaccharyl transferase STT3 subunit [Methanobacterium sp. PtaU1.Bin242]|nr:MAG: Oligosaccharyl transferase STT3 subunit [Methanobacterium sp. PtaU1.Bin242]